MASQPDPELVTRAEAGDPEAQNALGRFYAEDSSEPGRLNIAQTWFTRAADQGSARAMHNLGVLAWQRRERKSAMKWFESAAAAGWVASTLLLGQLREELGDLDGAKAYYQNAATRGYAGAQDALGRLAFDLETDAGYEQARHWSALAAEQGNANSQARLGTMYHEGLGVDRDPRRAFSYWMAAALAGHSGAQLAAGAALDVGAGVQRDRIKAAIFLLRSSAQGNGAARAYVRKLVSELDSRERAELERRLQEQNES